MMKSILLPTDGTVPSEEAALYAMDMAKRLRAKVKALYAVDDSLIPLPLPRSGSSHRGAGEGR